VKKLAEGVQQMLQPVTAIETLLSCVDANLLQFDQSTASNGASFVAYFCPIFACE